jgi:hypothetical protein
MIWAWGAIEADFFRFYNLDLNYVYENDCITWRKFIILIKGLPESSAFYRWYNKKDNRNFVDSSESEIEKQFNKVRGGEYGSNYR